MMYNNIVSFRYSFYVADEQVPVIFCSEVYLLRCLQGHVCLRHIRHAAGAYCFPLALNNCSTGMVCAAAPEAQIVWVLYYAGS